MSILITGASGFVGQNLTEYLLKRNQKLHLLSLRTKDQIVIPSDIKAVVHLAGKAHDLKGVSNEATYFEINTELTKRLYEAFCQSNAETFIYLSSVKAVADNPIGTVDEATRSTPVTAYGKSKLAAEEYLMANQKKGTQLYILRPCMIHGPNNKGNLNLLYQVVKKGFPYPLGSFANQRSYLSIENLCFVIHELISADSVVSGIYSMADDEVFSTNELIKLIGKFLNKKPRILSPPINLIRFVAKIGDYLRLPLSTERLQKLTNNYVVSNTKIKAAMGKNLPISGEQGFLKTFESFKNS